MSQQATIPLLAHTKTNNGNRCLPAYLDLDLEFWIHHLFLCKIDYQCLRQQGGPAFTVINRLVPKANILSMFPTSGQTRSGRLWWGNQWTFHCEVFWTLNFLLFGRRLKHQSPKRKMTHPLDFLQSRLASRSAATGQNHPGPPSCQVYGCLLPNARVAAWKSRVKLLFLFSWNETNKHVA